MRQILEEKNNTRLEGKEFAWNFNLQQDGFYAIEIVASCKSWRQNFSPKDDDLAIKINGTSFPQKKNSSRLFDAEMSWNGNKLKGLSKTNLFILPLKQGIQTLSFLIDKNPFLESIKVYQIEQEIISYLPPNNPPREGNRRPFLSIAVNGLALKHLKIKAKATKGDKYTLFFKDDEDIKLKINGKTQFNQEPKSHAHWYWCGRVLQGASKEFNQSFNQKSYINYLELLADRSPTLEAIELTLDLKSIQATQQTKNLLKAKITAKEAYLRQATDTTSKVLHTFKAGEQVFVFPEISQGQAPYKDKGDYTNTWHKVVFQSQEGYVFAKFIEIQGEDQETIKAKIIEIAKKHNQDPCLMLAIAQRESQFFPYATSDKGAKGLFQMTPIAINQTQKIFFPEEVGKEINLFDIDKNIELGILYFEYLQEKYKNNVDSLKKCLVAWNGGEASVSKEGRFQEKQYFKETRDFIRDVLDYQSKCNLAQKQGGKISLAFALICLDIVLVWSCLVLTLPYFLIKPLPEEYKVRTILSEQLIDVNGDGVEERLQAVCYKPECGLSANMSQILIAKSEDNFIEVPGHGAGFLWFKTGDFNQNGKLELLVDYDNYGNAGFQTWFLYEWRDDHFELLLEKTEILVDLKTEDLDNDDVSEIVQTFRIFRDGLKFRQIFKWNEQTQNYLLQKTIELNEF